MLSAQNKPGSSPGGPVQPTGDGTIFLLDVDNTLLDNDGFQAALGARLAAAFGEDQRARYWRIFEELRAKSGVADYLASLQGFRSGLDDDPKLLQMSRFLLEYPFADLLFPRTLDVIMHLRGMGRPVVLSDGDVVFQPRKIQHAGIWDAVQGDVLIYLHKEKVMDHVQKRYPASHYVVVDDKPNLLAAMKLVMRDELTTVFVRQGHYALAPGSNDVLPPPDRVIERIGDLMTLKPSDFKVQT
ncbi:MAG TPA: HAD family hydrolase [Steroidobacteraceae bacterium]|jgi:FMN phosphatase YigB (HAD superfamily)|nr:HAD family hydrolase [Steroidobacteraceae bacterium]